MTIALGFLCGDGVILASDEQYTIGDLKISGQKLFTLKPTDSITVCGAGAGSVNFMKMTEQKLEERLAYEFSGKETTTAGVRGIIEDVLSEVFQEHIYPIPVDHVPGGRPDIQFLMGIWVRDEPLSLILTDQASTHRVAGHACIGSGSPIARYLMDQLTGPEGWSGNASSWLFIPSRRPSGTWSTAEGKQPFRF